MIYYSPVDGDVRQEPIVWRPRTAFVMQQLGGVLPPSLRTTRKQVDRVLKRHRFKTVDASTVATGHDYLQKIWKLTVCCPVGIAIVHEGIAATTLANIYYEIGMMQAYGRETIVVRVGDVELPSDLTRTEYLLGGRGFPVRLSQFVESLAARHDSYLVMAGQLERNPLLAIDYLRRAYLLSGNTKLRARVVSIWNDARLNDRAAVSLERGLATF